MSEPTSRARYVWALPAPIRIKSTGQTGKLSMIAYGALVTEQGAEDILWIKLDSTGELVKVYGVDAERIGEG